MSKNKAIVSEDEEYGLVIDIAGCRFYDCTRKISSKKGIDVYCTYAILGLGLVLGSIFGTMIYL